MLASMVLRDVAERDGYAAVSRVICPLCTYDRQALVDCRAVAQGATVLRFEGGCGSRWQLQLEPGANGLQGSVSVQQACRRPSGLGPPADADEAERILHQHEL